MQFFIDFSMILLRYQYYSKQVILGIYHHRLQANMHLTDIFFFTDVLIVILAIRFIPKVDMNASLNGKVARKLYFVYGCAIMMLNLGLAETERPQLLNK